MFHWTRRGWSTMTRLKPRPFCLINVCLFMLIVTALIFVVVPAPSWANYRNPYILHTLSSQSEQLNVWLANGSLGNLQAGFPAVTVHYLWCHDGYFEFKHYVSILSIIKALQPDQIVFHYAHLPLSNPYGSMTWFEDIQRDVTFLILKKDSDSLVCGDADVRELSGIIIREDVAVINFTRMDFFKLTKYSQGHRNTRVFLFPSASLSGSVMEGDGVLVSCVSVKNLNEALQKDYTIPCVHIHNNLTPEDTFIRQEKIYKFAKNLVYGPKSTRPKSYHRRLVPLDCHVLHFNGSEKLDFMAYASVMSALKVGGLRHVYLHSDRLQSGSLFDRAMKNRNVTFVHVPHLHHFHPTSSDVIYGAYVLLRHGGVVVRSDTIWRKKIPNDLQAYDASVPSPSRNNSSNSSFDFSVLISQSNSKFLKLLISTVRHSTSKTPQTGIEEVAYKVYIERPDSVNIDTKLIQYANCSSRLKVCHQTSFVQDSALVKVSWDSQPPRLKSDMEQYSGNGASCLKDILKNVN